MKNTIIVIAILATLGTANAAPPSVCGNGQHTHNPHCTTDPTPAPTTPGTVNNGGTAAALAAAQARAEARATAIAAQQQAQRQQQTQRQVAKGGSAKVTNTVNVSLPAAATTAETKTALTEQPVKEAAAAKSEPLIVAPAQERDPVATAYAAPLTATNGTCMGSTTGGVQFAGWGASGGSTWTDNNCDIRYDAEALRAAGLHKAAIARLCQKADIEKAMALTDTPCPGTKAAEAKRAAAVLNDEPVPARQVSASASLQLLP
ncbi:hypothetical protein J7E62_27450 [Variovorax paradoxus]|nr:hypothetical protein [Variovorax paradoxus]